jgi:predicted nucleic acid-binding protein
MKVLVDTSVWSLAFRKTPKANEPAVEQLRELIAAGHTICYTGVILTELLQGVRSEMLFKQIEKQFDALDLLELSKHHYVNAAKLSQLCRSSGVTAGTIDYLIAAAAIEHSCSLLSTDKDFQRIAQVSSLTLLKF